MDIHTIISNNSFMEKRMNKGLKIVAATVFLTLAIWIGSKIYFQDVFEMTWPKYIAKAASLSAVILMCWSVILSARFRFVENWFGGLDRVYQAHKKIGKTAFLLILIHPIFLAVNKLPSIELFIRNFWFLSIENSTYNLGHNVGILAISLMTILIALSVYIKIPYHIWKKSHELFGLVLVLAIFHVLIVNQDVATYPLLSFWIYGVFIFTIYSLIYIQILYKFFGPRFNYRISDIEVVDKSLELTMTPENKIMDYHPGQFAYISFCNKKISREAHPYSISYSPQKDGQVKFGIKQLGDYTETLVDLEIGNRAILYGPYGKFGDKFVNSNKDCVFVGGGIGITPFLGMWDYKLANSDFKPAVDVFYVVGESLEGSFDNDMQKIAIKNKYENNVTHSDCSYELYESNKNGYITADYIIGKTGNSKDKLFFMCGPRVMCDGLINDLKKHGVRNSQIIMEDFNILHFPKRKTLADWLKF